MSWLARQHLPSRTLPFSLIPGELIWLAAARREPLTWVFSPTDETTTSQLRDKIKSKMDAAKVLGSFSTALVTFGAAQLLREPDRSVLFGVLAAVGLTLLVIATVLFFVTLFRYDGLLMPRRFWSPGRSAASGEGTGLVRRPPGSETWVLYQNMVRVWNRAFVPAVLSAAFGVTLLAVAFAEPEGWWWLMTPGAVGVVVISGAVSLSQARPVLGVND